MALLNKNLRQKKVWQLIKQKGIFRLLYMRNKSTNIDNQEMIQQLLQTLMYLIFLVKK